MSFIKDLLSFTQDAESPSSYFKWCAYATLSAVLRDNCKTETQYGEVYPNLYIMLLSSKSSITRKNLPMNLALELVQEINNTHIIAGRASLPGIVKVLRTSRTNENGYMIKGASAFLWSGELTAFLYKDSDTIDILTDLYEFHKKWPVTLAGDPEGVQILENTCVTFFAATNEENLPMLFDRRAQKGGLLARTLFVREEKRKQIRSYLRKGKFLSKEEKETLKISLISQLKDIASLKGNFIIDKNAAEEFNSWYESITDEKISDTGIEGRIGTHVLKLAMLISSSERLDLRVTVNDIKSAIDECVRLLKTYKIITSTVAVNPDARVGALILKELLMAPNYTLSLRQLLQRLWVEGLDKDALIKILETYVTADIVEQKMDTKKGEIVVILTKNALDQYREKTK